MQQVRGDGSHKVTMQHSSRKKAGFTLLEMMAVVVLIMVMLAMTGLYFANSQTSVQIRADANNLVAFMRNMWDRTKATGEPLILEPDFESGKMSYSDPRSGLWRTAKFRSEAKVLAIILNDRVHTSETSFRYDYDDYPADGEDGEENVVGGSLFLSEARGLARISIVIGILRDDVEEGFSGEDYETLMMATLNLINGRGSVEDLESMMLDDLKDKAMTQQDEEDVQTPLPPT